MSANRLRLQVSLSTAILILFVLSFALWINLIPERVADYAGFGTVNNSNVFGLPFRYRIDILALDVPTDLAWSTNLDLIRSRFEYSELVKNVLFWAAVVFLLAVTCMKLDPKRRLRNRVV